MKIGLYGGTFNPVHCEHVNVARAAVETLGLDKIIIIPTFLSPHKRGETVVRGRERMEMCRLAFRGIAEAEVSDCEISRGGVSYSYVTCRRFKKLYPDDELFLIMGADMLATFHRWKEPEEILRCVTPAVCAREGEKDLKTLIRKFCERFRHEIVSVNYVGKGVSSTRVRVLAALGEPIAPYVPEDVAAYVRSHGLYARPDLQKVRKYLTPARWQHTVRVAVMAAQNCSRVGLREEDAVTAAALHDCAKYLPFDAPELKGFAPPPDVPEPVLHQYSGAYVAERVFGVTDQDLLNAIRYHTSGRENMSGAEKLLYLSDMLEEGRDFDGVESLRNLFTANIDLALYAALDHQLKYLETTGAPVYPLTQRAYESIKNHIPKTTGAPVFLTDSRSDGGGR